MSTREQALVALLERLRAEFEPAAVVQRNLVTDEPSPRDGLIVLRDGDPGEPLMAIGLSSPWYHFEHVATVEVMVAEADDAMRSAILDQMVDRVAAIIGADPRLGGAVTASRVLPPEIEHDREPAGIGHGYARVPIVLQFATSSPVG